MVLLKLNYRAILMWLLTLSFFAYQFILRLWPSLMMHDIMSQFGVNAASFGFLASVYYYGYAGFQIPLALLLERVRAKYVISSCALICGVATYVGAHTHYWYLALFMRFLVGIGSSVGFLGVSKVISEWFSENYYSRMVGLSFSLGLMGAIYGGKPISLLIEKVGKGQVVNILSVVAIAIAIVILFLLKSPAGYINPNRAKTFKYQDLKKILNSRVIYLLALANLLMVGSLEGFADVWGLNYLMSIYKIPKTEAAGIVSFIFVGMLFGGPILAYLANKSDNLSIIQYCGLWMAFLLFLLLFNGEYLTHYKLITLFTAIGILCCYQVLVFAAGGEYVDKNSLGITVAFLNCINMLGGSFFHTIIGIIIDYNGKGQFIDGNKIYDLTSYRVALSIIPICALLGSGIIGFIKLNTKKQSKIKKV